MSIERQKTGFQPIISAILGSTNAALVHPMKIFDPINPTMTFD